MQGWVQKNREAFERDVLRDFCLVSDKLVEQFERFQESGGISFPVLRDLVGEPWDKGLLWRLKDKAHHILLKAENASVTGLLLDWTLGYIFHESLKLMEDAHQRQYYAPRLSGITDSGLCPQMLGLIEGLRLIQAETRESMRRENDRLRTLLLHSRKLFCHYFAGRSEHRPLARFLHDNNALVRHIFQDDYQVLIRLVYGDEPERMPIEAARSLLESARFEQAAGAVAAALEINPQSREALALQAECGQRPLPGR